MKKLLLILLCLPLISLAQQTYVPDDNFENYLESNGMGNGIANDDSVFTSAIDTVTYLDVNNLSISDLTGIGDFTALTELRCNSNQLTSLDVIQNTALEILWCHNNNLTSLDISNNTSLTYLNCRDNQLTTLDVSNNTSLAELWCHNNNLTSLDISNNTSLTYLHCGNNQLTTLDVSQDTALNVLFCWFNQLTSIDVSNNTALTSLQCQYNDLTSLDVSNNTALTYLDCAGNQLINIDVSNNTALTSLQCHDNDLKNLDVSNNTALNTLYCQYNYLASLDVRNGNNTNIINFNSLNNPNLYCIDVDDAAWSTANWTNIDAWASFNTNCAIALACTDTLACNYDSLATIDDGSCIYSTTSYDTIVSNISISWNGMFLTTSGDYSVTLTNSWGSALNITCDSITNLNLTITTTGIVNLFDNKNKEILKIINVLGRETKGKKNELLFYIYDDGTVEKRITIE